MNNETLKRDLCARLMERVEVCVRTNLLSYTHKPYKEYKKVLTPAILAKIIKGGQYNYIKPMLFPTSALAKPIRLANYNNGEPFVPMDEMRKIGINDHIDYVSIEADGLIHDRGHSEWLGGIPFKIIELLNQWHINYRLSPDQFIEVTDENNPYV